MEMSQHTANAFPDSPLGPLGLYLPRITSMGCRAANNGKGVFDYLPSEIRSYIFGYVLDFNHLEATVPPSSRNETPPTLLAAPHLKDRTALLRTSKAICSESQTIMFNVNEFEITMRPGGMHYDDSRPDNVSAAGHPGWGYTIAYAHLRKGFGIDDFSSLIIHSNYKDWRSVHLRLGVSAAVSEVDIEPVSRQEIVGPEVRNYQSFMDALKIVVLLFLQSPMSLRWLMVDIRCTVERPASLPSLLAAIAEVRSVKEGSVMVHGAGDDVKTVWRLGSEYVEYFETILKEPYCLEPVEMPEDDDFEQVEEEEDQDTDEEDVEEVDPEDQDLMDEFGMDEDEVRNFRDQELLDIDPIDYYDDLDNNEFFDW
ncbi:uncharacterized protein PAC_06117 [Phialocephala subalpina]|uniref:F-box domain-containing protein n=1 Tax=Phialocephala subalpina TaxID=576137 RepID=A0A1L7WTZ9_9HELO|nr:uncharacterized protein PAC_06117 [Phialocephala subalpina]